MRFSTQVSLLALTAAMLATAPALAQLDIDTDDGLRVEADLGAADAEVDVDLGGDPDVSADVGLGDDDVTAGADVDLDDGVDADVDLGVGDVDADVDADVDLGGDDGIGADVDIGIGGDDGDDGNDGANGGGGGGGNSGGNPNVPGVPNGTGGGSGAGGLAMSNGVFCDQALAGQILGLIQSVNYAPGDWQSANGVQLVEVEICAELLGQLQAAAAAQRGALQNAIAGDALVSASLNRNGVAPGEVLVVWPAQGVLNIYFG